MEYPEARVTEAVISIVRIQRDEYIGNAAHHETIMKHALKQAEEARRKMEHCRALVEELDAWISAQDVAAT